MVLIDSNTRQVTKNFFNRIPCTSGGLRVYYYDGTMNLIYLKAWGPIPIATFDIKNKTVAFADITSLTIYSQGVALGTLEQAEEANCKVLEIERVLEHLKSLE